MPIIIELDDSQGEVIETLDDTEDVLHRTLPYYDDMTFRLLNKIDWYGDTEFEAAQATVLLRELDRIMPKAAGPDAIRFLNELKPIVTRCDASPGSKLKFLGD